MSVPNKSLDKNKRYAGVKANDFVNKTRANEANRSAVRPQGWANLGKINSRRIPPPANLPSLKSEIGVSSPTFDPPSTPNYGWSSTENTTSTNVVSNPTQQQLDSMPVSSRTPPPLISSQPSSADVDKSRAPPSWSTITASGTSSNMAEPPPNLLGLNDFPRLATTPDRKSQPESPINPTFRPTNLATWKEGGGSRIQPLVNDLSQMIPNNPGANFYQQQSPMPNVRMYSPQMWTYNPYPPVPSAMPQSQRVNNFNDYKSPTILRNKDIDDLSKITDNTWANASQEVNYEEKIRFSDDEEDNHRRELPATDNKTRRTKPQILQHTRLLQDDEHLKQMQDNKNSELINALNIAKQRRDEQERHLRNEQFNSNMNEQKQIPGYQTRPLLNSNDQENHNSSPSWQRKNRENCNPPRAHHDTANSQSSFTMKSWSDQMDSFNYASLHEKSGGAMENDDPAMSNNYSRSPSESSLPSQNEKGRVVRKSKKLPLSSKKSQKPSLNPTKSSTKKLVKFDSKDYYENSNDQWETWEEQTDNRQQQCPNDNNNNNNNQQRRRQQLHSDDSATQRSNRFNKQVVNKTNQNDKQQTNSHVKPNSAPTNKTNQISDTKSMNNKNQPAWRSLSPNRPTESVDPTPQESMSYKSQQRTNLNDHKQRYPPIDTSSIPPLMSVRSNLPIPTSKSYQTTNHTGAPHYDDENAYYESNLQAHQRYQHSHLQNRGYTTLGSYGRYRRSGTLRHQQQYTTYNTTNTSAGSSAPSTSNGTRQKKNANNKKVSSSSDQSKSAVADNVNSPTENVKTINDEIPVVKSPEPLIPSPSMETGKLNESNIGINEQKNISKTDNENNTNQNGAESTTKANKKSTPFNSKRRTNKDQQTYQQDQRYQNQQAPRHRNIYQRSIQEYDTMSMTGTHNYYGTTRRMANNGRNTHIHDLSSNYYYEHPQQHYNNRYNNYSNEHYQQSSRQTTKHTKRNGTSAINNRHQKQHVVNGDTNNTNNNHRHHSTSDNDQKEGEEWETASESSMNMRNGHYDNNQSTNEIKAVHRGRTPPKKSFSSQRPHARQIFKYTNA
ncbi:unnamed protein product [Adineta ricciae]|uniref:BAT2 N-terminal domain-containing protein n=1 Tax=Adineta ricciae TaxID=249248 RepID=A0A814UW48_ADIRI|nr:unnamed protein product [Adineta ricciae]CAF1180515.1 unnamed protein product [Adineta ricciae]